jgi:hypothetical protein
VLCSKRSSFPQTLSFGNSVSVRAGPSGVRGGVGRSECTSVDLVEEASALESRLDSESESEFGDEVRVEYAEPLGGPEQQELPFFARTFA